MRASQSALIVYSHILFILIHRANKLSFPEDVSLAFYLIFYLDRKTCFVVIRTLHYIETKCVYLVLNDCVVSSLLLFAFFIHNLFVLWRVSLAERAHCHIIYDAEMNSKHDRIHTPRARITQWHSMRHILWSHQKWMGRMYTGDDNASFGFKVVPDTYLLMVVGFNGYSIQPQKFQSINFKSNRRNWLLVRSSTV